MSFGWFVAWTVNCQLLVDQNNTVDCCYWLSAHMCTFRDASFLWKSQQSYWLYIYIRAFRTRSRLQNNFMSFSKEMVAGSLALIYFAICVECFACLIDAYIPAFYFTNLMLKLMWSMVFFIVSLTASRVRDVLDLKLAIVCPRVKLILESVPKLN